MKPAFLHFFFFLTLFSCITALEIAVPSSPLSGAPTTITWKSAGPSDPPKFDLRFMVDNADVGLAVANVVIGDSPSGVVNVTFPKPGPYVLIAVTGAWPNYIQVGTSNQVTVVQAPANSMTASSPTPSSTTSAVPGPPSSSPSPISASRSPTDPSTNRRAILIASCTLGALFSLFIIAAIIIFIVLRRRRQREAEDRRRWTFHKDLMVQRRDQPGGSVITVIRGEAPPRVELDFDLERAGEFGQRQAVFATVPFVMRSPKGPRPKTSTQTPHYPFVSAGNAGPGNR